MVKIRLKRIGKRHEPHFRIVAQDSRYFRSGKVLEEIGYYNPAVSPAKLDYDKAILDKWLKQGAQLSDTLHDLFVKEKIVKQDKSRVAQIKKIIEASKKRKSEKKGEEKKPELKAKDSPSEDSAPEEKAEEPKAEPKIEKPEEEAQKGPQVDEKKDVVPQKGMN